jgi:hypothetical protein
VKSTTERVAGEHFRNVFRNNTKYLEKYLEKAKALKIKCN